MAFPSDLEIAQAANLRPLTDIAAQMGIAQHLLEPYGDDVAKIKLRAIEELADRPQGQVRRRHGDHADAARRGQDHDDRRSRAGDAAHRQAVDDRHPPAVDGPDVRDQGRRGRRRLQPGHPDGDAQPAPDRRLPRGDRGAQPAVGDGRQPPAPGQRARPRPRQHHLAARARRQRPRAAQHRHRARRARGRRHPADRLRHHRCVRGDGDPGADAARSATCASALGTHRRRLHARRQARHGRATSALPARWRRSCATRSSRT